jgi:hypothetical protein
MSSNRSKGTTFQKVVKEYFEARGWCIYNKAIGSRYEKGRDIFGCDLIAKHHSHDLTLWIQATSDAAASTARKLEPLRSIPWSRDGDVVLIIIKRTSKIWALYEYTQTEKIREKDYYLFGKITGGVFAETAEADRHYTKQFLKYL